jgi:hypothetical protein
MSFFPLTTEWRSRLFLDGDRHQPRHAHLLRRPWVSSPATPSAPPPIWAPRWSPSRSCTARATSASISTKTASRPKTSSPGPSRLLHRRSPRITVTVEDRTVTVRAWRYDMVGRAGHIIPIYLLDTDLPENSAWDRSLTDHLYGGDSNYRLQQEIVLGMGGVRMLNALGHIA